MRRRFFPEIMILLLCWPLAGNAVSVANRLSEISLPDETVALIDPLTGVSSGSGGSDVRIAVGDVLLFRFAFEPLPDLRQRAIQSYLTVYVPSGAELVGARIIGEDGTTAVPRWPGLAYDGCIGGSDCNDFDDLPCSAGAASGTSTSCTGMMGEMLRSFAGGGISQLYGDTGIFFSNDLSLSRVPSDAFISPENGIEMNLEPSIVDADLAPLLGYSSPYYSHNQWDWTQVQAYGALTAVSGSGGNGNTPHLYGSPVAGSDQFFPFEATDSGMGVEFNDITGPWQRMMYPDSRTGFGDCLSNSSAGLFCMPEATNSVLRRSIPTASGLDIKPANAAAAKAVRIALGEAWVGHQFQAEVALRVTAVPIDPDFGPSGDNVLCAEASTGALSSRITAQDGEHNPWPVYIATPMCTYLGRKVDLKASQLLSDGGALNFDLEVANLAINPEGSVIVRQLYDESLLQFVSALPPADGQPTNCPAGYDISKFCLSWTIGDFDPSQEVMIETSFNPLVADGISISRLYFESDAAPIPGPESSAVTILAPIAKPVASLAPAFDPTASFAASESQVAVTGMIGNDGTAEFAWDSLVLMLPDGWRVVDNEISVGGMAFPCDANCDTETPRFPITTLSAASTDAAVAFSLDIPASTDTDLYPVHLQTWGSQSGFGGDFETMFPEIMTVNVGAVRSQPPIVDCPPILSTAPQVSGTSEPDSAISLRFNLMERGQCTADVSGDWTCGFAGFGEMYGGLEVRATASAPSELESELSEPCIVVPAIACNDGVDNDLDGLTDFPADPGCTDFFDTTEDTEIECSDGVDNDLDGFTDYPDDPDCYAETDESEADTCDDGIDNDHDGLVDYVKDPKMGDPGCAAASDHNEMSYPECADGVDNDGNLDADFPLDPDCDSAVEDDEVESMQVPSTGPRLILAIAASGTLNSNTCELEFTDGDGSDFCPGTDVACADLPGACTGGSALTCENGLADDSRLYKIKAGASLAMLRGDAQFGLIRSRQRAVEFMCPSASPLGPSGGWQGGAGLCEGFDSGEVLVRIAEDNQDSLQRYLDGATTIGPDFLFSPGHDFELRASGERPLAGILTTAGEYVDELRAADPYQACRPYQVVLVADGADSCGGDAAAAADALWTDGVPVHVLGFAASDAPDVMALNAIAAAGGSDNALFVDDSASLASALSQIVDQSIYVELCNGLDDDCDGEFDEDFTTLGEACSNGLLGVCAAEGQFMCSASGLGTECSAPPISGSPEVCNLLDDDCDGEIDEGGVCAPTEELCNGMDDDGDELIDEDFPIGLACTDGQLGICRGTGHYECSMDQLGVDCVIDEPGQAPAPFEMCNALDDDCDGMVDEGAFGEMVEVTGGPAPFWIGKYEASRPDATADYPGSLDHRACSNEGVQPWRLVTQSQAAAACSAAGLRLCTEDEWQQACEGSSGNLYPYGNSYDPLACNGEEYDPDCALPDEDTILPTGTELGCPATANTCVSEFGAFDMSGNVSEWTSTEVAVGYFRTRGGDFTDPASPLSCAFNFRTSSQETVSPGLGFRCCANQLPVPSVFENGFESLVR